MQSLKTLVSLVRSAPDDDFATGLLAAALAGIGHEPEPMPTEEMPYSEWDPDMDLVLDLLHDPDPLEALTAHVRFALEQGIRLLDPKAHIVRCFEDIAEAPTGSSKELRALRQKDAEDTKSVDISIEYFQGVDLRPHAKVRLGGRLKFV